jgi:hypothetical protein
MSVINDNNNDELMTAFNELESKVLILLENMKKMDRRLRAIEEVAKTHGIKVTENMIEADQCTIN